MRPEPDIHPDSETLENADRALRELSDQIERARRLLSEYRDVVRERIASEDALDALRNR